MDKKKMFKADEVAVMVGISSMTLKNWYRFKRLCPESEWAKKLPQPVQEHTRGTNYWKPEDIPILIEFKKSVPRGRKGVMGDATQMYIRKRDNKEDNQNEQKRNFLL